MMTKRELDMIRWLADACQGLIDWLEDPFVSESITELSTLWADVDAAKNIVADAKRTVGKKEATP